MGALVLDEYYIQLTLSVVIGIILIIIAFLFFKKDIKIASGLCILIAILLFLNAIRIYYEVEEIKRESYEEDYEYQLNITPSNNTTYKILFPIPDNKILDDYNINGNATIQINNTEHGLALEIISTESIEFETTINDAKSLDLQMEEEKLYYIYKWSNVTNIISVHFQYTAVGCDWVSTQSFNGNLNDGWNLYEFSK